VRAVASRAPAFSKTPPGRPAQLRAARPCIWQSADEGRRARSGRGCARPCRLFTGLPLRRSSSRQRSRQARCCFSREQHSALRGSRCRLARPAALTERSIVVLPEVEGAVGAHIGGPVWTECVWLATPRTDRRTAPPPATIERREWASHPAKIPRLAPAAVAVARRDDRHSCARRLQGSGAENGGSEGVDPVWSLRVAGAQGPARSRWRRSILVRAEAIVYVRDLERMCAFYRRCVELEVGDAAEDYAVLESEMWLIARRRSAVDRGDDPALRAAGASRHNCDQARVSSSADRGSAIAGGRTRWSSRSDWHRVAFPRVQTVRRDRPGGQRNPTVGARLATNLVSSDADTTPPLTSNTRRRSVAPRDEGASAPSGARLLSWIVSRSLRRSPLVTGPAQKLSPGRGPRTRPPPFATAPQAQKPPGERGLLHSGGGIRTRDLRVMRCTESGHLRHLSCRHLLSSHLNCAHICGVRDLFRDRSLREQESLWHRPAPARRQSAPTFL